MNLMKPYQSRKLKGDEWLLVGLVVVLLIIIPCLPLGKYGGGIAMVAVSVIGMVAYIAVFGKRLRSRGQMKAFTMISTVSLGLGAALALALWLIRAYGH